MLTGSHKESASGGREVIFTEYHDFNAALKAPSFSDGLKKFFPLQMQNDAPADLGESSCLIIDVRAVTVTVTPAGTGSTGAGSASSEQSTHQAAAAAVAVAVEPAVPGKSYWTIMPLDTKKLQGMKPAVGGQYVAGGAFQVGQWWFD